MIVSVLVSVTVLNRHLLYVYGVPLPALLQYNDQVWHLDKLYCVSGPLILDVGFVCAPRQFPHV